MKLLEKKFVKNCEGVGDTTFEQIKKQSVGSVNVYIYNRYKENKSFNKFEVFIAKQRFKGQPLPAGNVEAEDREQYPTANAFGFTAKEANTLIAAESFFKEFVKKANAKEGDESPKRAGLDYPKGNFSMKDLLAKNSDWSQPSAYIQVRKDIDAKVVKEVGRVKSESGRGKPSVVYHII